MESKPKIAPCLAIASTLVLTGCHEVAVDDHHDDHHGHTSNAVSVEATISGYDWAAYAAYVPHGTGQLEVDLHRLSQDADLYVESPDGHYSCESLHVGTQPDSCVFDYPAAGEWYVEVFGWAYDPLDYTLTVTLWPSDLEPSLWLIGQSATAASALSFQRTAEDSGAAARFLPLLKAATDRARSLPFGESAFGIADADGNNLGTAVVRVEERGQRRALHLKAIMADPRTGDKHVLQTDAERPLVLTPFTDAPESGALHVRRRGRVTAVVLGTTTGTGAQVQLVTEPGPVTREQTWAAIPGTLSLHQR